jgi:hypothetical protein
MIQRRAFSILMWGAPALAAALLFAETQPAPHFTATLANVAGAPDTARIEILRWSSDEERDRLMAAWNLKSASNGAGRGVIKGAAKGGGKGAAKAAPAAASEAPALIPDAELAKALQEATTVGYLWTSELSGYALRYAGQTTMTDGSQRIVLITQRRLGAMNQKWAPASGTPNQYAFSVIELRLNAKGEGEGKASLTGKVAADAAVKVVTLENYGSSPVVFTAVKGN